MNAFCLRPLILACGLGASLPAVAQDTSFNLHSGNASLICLYSHTLADDATAHPHQPGVAMRHDFFGNTAANAHTTGRTLLDTPDSTCENAADGSAYWAPSLKLADGTIVPPSYQKAYYTNIAVPSSLRQPVNTPPMALQMLAGDPDGTGPNPRISFLCTGRGYTNTIPTDCVPDPVKGTQLNIGVSFPTCWDGNNLAPMLRPHHGGYNNMAYPNSSGACPSGYPVRIPHVSMNIAYMIGHVRDLTGAQLSIDPRLDAHGKPEQERWGSLYSAHADFFNGWQPNAIHFMVEYCLNKGRACHREIPYSFTEPEADAMVVDGEGRHTRLGGDIKLATEAAQGTATPQSHFFMRFSIPGGADKLPPRFTPQYKIQIHGANITGASGGMLQVYTTDINWNEHNLTMDSAPACGGKLAGRLFLDGQFQYREIDVTEAVQTARQAGQTLISFCVKAARQGNAYGFHSREGAHKPVLYLRAVKELPY